MKRSPLHRRTPLRARTRLRSVSKKRSRVNRLRREFVRIYLEEHPVCEVRGCSRRAVDVHERKTRARGGALLDPANCLAVCRGPGGGCHDFIHANPKWATEQGYLIPSWEAHEEATT